MFTGLVTDIGRVTAVMDMAGIRVLRMESAYPEEVLSPGASIMHAGVCLTLTDFGDRDGGGSWWAAHIVPETLSRTTLGLLRGGDRINLERSLRLGDEMGGHLVYGHVDAVAEVLAVAREGEARRIRFALPPNLAPLVAEKGSVAIDGVSLTVAAVGKDAARDWFEVALIPHTLKVTTLGALSAGQRVNLEADMLARYVARMLGRAAK